jgi:hypothetical protein
MALCSSTNAVSFSSARRDLSLFQINFYGFLQEFILREMDTW